MKVNYLRPKEVWVMLSIKKTTLWKNVKLGLLPKPIRLGGSTLFREDEIHSSIEKLRVEQRKR